MDQRKQAKRQFAGMLANYCTDVLDLQPSRGGTIHLDPNTPINCGGLNARKIGELITEVDQLLIDLEGQSLNDPTVKAKYTAIISCTDGINNGRNIPVAAGCEETSGTSSSSDLGGGDEAPATDSQLTTLYRPTPNPFTGVTRFAYAVDGANGAQVDIAIYDVAGRQVKKLVSSFQAAGRYDAQWDGTSDDGVKVTRGVYFVRTVIAGQKTPVQRILYVRD
jgi:hypothetical protein